MAFGAFNLVSIKNSAIIFDEVKVTRRDDVFDLSISASGKEQHIFTGGAEASAQYLNEYFDLKK